MGGQPAGLREPDQETRHLPVLSSGTNVEERPGPLGVRPAPANICLGTGASWPKPTLRSSFSSFLPEAPAPSRGEPRVLPFSVAKPKPHYLTLRLFARICAAAGAPFRPAAAGRGGSRSRRLRGRRRLRLRATSPRRGALRHRLPWLLGGVLDLCCEYYAKPDTSLSVTRQETFQWHPRDVLGFNLSSTSFIH